MLKTMEQVNNNLEYVINDLHDHLFLVHDLTRLPLPRLLCLGFTNNFLLIIQSTNYSILATLQIPFKLPSCTIIPKADLS